MRICPSLVAYTTLPHETPMSLSAPQICLSHCCGLGFVLWLAAVATSGESAGSALNTTGYWYLNHNVAAVVGSVTITITIAVGISFVKW